MIVRCVLKMGNAPSYNKFNGLWQCSSVFNGTNHNPPQAQRLLGGTCFFHLWMMILDIAHMETISILLLLIINGIIIHMVHILLLLLYTILVILSYSILLLLSSFYWFIQSIFCSISEVAMFSRRKPGTCSGFCSLLRPRIEPRRQHQRQHQDLDPRSFWPSQWSKISSQVEAVQLQRSEVKLNGKSM